MGLLIFYLLLAIGVSFLCSILEAVLLSINDTYVLLLEKESPRDGRILKRLRQDIDNPLATILSLNTIAHTVGAAGVGAQSLALFGDAYVALTSALLTLLILVFSEIIPKTLGARYWRGLAPLSGRILVILVRVLYPFVWMSRHITRLIAEKNALEPITREELSAVIDKVAHDGQIEQGEFHVFKNLLSLESMRARDIMTPRVVVVSVDQESSVKEAFDTIENLRFSRLPLYRGDREHITGYLLKTDLLLEAAHDRWSAPLDSLRREILVIPDILDVRSVFNEMTSRQEQLAALVDEYGGFSGIVSMEDVVETMLGLEIIDEADDIEDMQQLARQKWLERSMRSKLAHQVEFSGADAMNDRTTRP